ncbi:MAG: hypothetical protein R3C11_16835 [Planctomycetaceae bacterium]
MPKTNSPLELEMGLPNIVHGKSHNVESLPAHNRCWQRSIHKVGPFMLAFGFVERG